MKYLFTLPILLISILFFGCKTNTEEVPLDAKQVAKMKLSLAEANNLASLPLACVQKEYPNKTGTL
jgi:hypothetical protein